MDIVLTCNGIGLIRSRATRGVRCLAAVSSLTMILFATELSADECGVECSHPEKVCLCVVDPPDTAISLIPLGSIERRPVRVGQALEIGDELLGTDVRGLVELTCPSGTEVKLDGQFRVVIMPGGEGQDCTFNLLSGAADVLTDQPTQLEAGGEVTMASRRTQYGMRVRREADAASVECLVFDGEVELSAPDPRWRYELTSGQKTRWIAGRPLRDPSVPGGLESPHRVSRQDIEGAAQKYARTHIARLQTQGVQVDDPRALRGDLVRSYRQVLVRPSEPRPRIDLAEIYLRVGSPKQALYHLGRAERLEPAQREERAAIAVAKWTAYEQSGREEAATREAETVRELDPALYKSRIRDHRTGPTEPPPAPPEGRIRDHRTGPTEPPPPPPESRIRDHRSGPTQPPPPQPESRPPERRGFVWVEGHWEWEAGEWKWKRGKWERERSGMRWEPGRWERRGDRYVFVRGRWVQAEPE
jgi:hypothetical protein